MWLQRVISLGLGFWIWDFDKILKSWAGKVRDLIDLASVPTGRHRHVHTFPFSHLPQSHEIGAVIL